MYENDITLKLSLEIDIDEVPTIEAYIVMLQTIVKNCREKEGEKKKTLKPKKQGKRLNLETVVEE